MCQSISVQAIILNLFIRTKLVTYSETIYWCKTSLFRTLWNIYDGNSLWVCGFYLWAIFAKQLYPRFHRVLNTPLCNVGESIRGRRQVLESPSDEYAPEQVHIRHEDLNHKHLPWLYCFTTCDIDSIFCCNFFDNMKQL